MTTQKLLLLLFLALFSLSLSHFYTTKDKNEKLILFTDIEKPIISIEEIENIRNLAEEMDIPFFTEKNTEGLPKEISTLPSIYFQNRKGRSKYYGRYSNISRIKNFIRTSKLAHQQNEVNQKKHTLVWKKGRADVTAPIKLTDLTGTLPKHFKQTKFKAQAKKAVAKGMEKFQLLANHNLTKNTRSFYFNIYPYLSETQELYLTTEVFSQYNCVQPIYTHLEKAIVKTKWKDRKIAFEKVGKQIEKEILRQIQGSEAGDAFTIVSQKTKEISWESLGFAIEKTDISPIKKTATNTQLTQKWKVAQRLDDKEPIIIFSFLSPVDNYAGEVKALSGTLELSENLSLHHAKGQFFVNIADVTMGAKDFDSEVQNKMLKMGLFPKASFKFVATQGKTTTLQMGKPEKLSVEGTFKMMGIDIPIDVNTTIEPFIDEQNKPKLQVNCTFQLPLLEKFAVEGPDGPSPAKDVLQFYMQFDLEELNDY